MISNQKKWLCIGVVLLFSISKQLKAQSSDPDLISFKKVVPSRFSIGIEVGTNNNYLLTNASDLNSTEYTSLKGFNVGIPILFKINDWFSLKTNPSVIAKNYSIHRTGYYTGVYRDTKNTYLQLPLISEFSFGEQKVKGYLDLGIYAAYWQSSRIKGAMPNILNQPPYGTYINNSDTLSSSIFQDYNAYKYDENYQFNKIVDNRIELGVIIGGGISYQVDESSKVYVEAKYYDATTDQQKNYQQGLVPKYNETYSFSIGYLYQLKKKAHVKTKKVISTDSSINN